MLKKIVFLILIICNHNSFAFDLVSCESSYIASTNFKLPFDNKKVKFKDSRQKLSVNIPLPIKSLKIFLINGFSYTYNKINLETQAGDYKESFESIGYSAMIMRKLNEKWSLLGRVGLSLNYPEFSEINSNDFKYNFMLSGNYKYSENLKLGCGAFYSRITGGALLLPSISLMYETKKQSLKFIPPVIMSYDYKFNKNTSLGLYTRIIGNEFELKSKELDEAFTLKFSELVSGISYKQHIWKGIEITLNSGIAYGYRNLDFLRGNDKIENSEVKPGYIGSLKLSYSPKFKKTRK